MSKQIWITWESQRRNLTLSNLLQVELFVLEKDAVFWIRYPVLIFKTLKVVYKTKPDIIFAQNPSLILAALVVVLGKIIRRPVVLDAHNAGIYPVEGKYRLLNWVASLVNRSASLVIVSNDALKPLIEFRGGRAVSFPDPLPNLSFNRQSKFLAPECFNIVYICSWADDEPYEEVIKAASSLNGNTKLFITGNHKGIGNRFDLEQISDTATLTGFVSDQDYEDLICGCDAIIALTTRENCLLCGAYEAVEAEKALILSDTTALKEYFSSGVIFTPNTAESLVNAISTVKKDIEFYRGEIRKLKLKLQNDNELELITLRNTLNLLCYRS